MRLSVFALLALVALDAFAGACRPIETHVTPPRVSATTKPVAVYWDVSASVDGRFSREISFLINNLDSTILQIARATGAISHYAVGDTVGKAQRDASFAEHRGERKSALHSAAEQIGERLARGEIAAAIMVSDLEVDRPDWTGTDKPSKTAGPAEGSVICGSGSYGVPFPTNPNAGPILGRCFAAGWRSVKGRMDDMFLTIFRSTRKAGSTWQKQRVTKHVYVLIFSTDPVFGEHIVQELGRRAGKFEAPTFDQLPIIDSNQRPTVSVEWSADRQQVRSAKGHAGRCAFTCYDPRGLITLSIRNENQGEAAPVHLREEPIITVIPGAGRTMTSRPFEYSWTLPCPELSREFHDGWFRARYVWMVEDQERLQQKLDIDHPEVEDAIFSLVTEIQPLMTDRRLALRIRIH